MLCGAGSVMSTASGTSAYAMSSTASCSGRASAAPSATRTRSSVTGPSMSHRYAPWVNSSTTSGSNGSLSSMSTEPWNRAPRSTSTGFVRRMTICSSPSNLVSSNVSTGKNSSVGPPLTNVSVPLVGVYSSPAIAFERSVAKSMLTSAGSSGPIARFSLTPT